MRGVGGCARRAKGGGDARQDPEEEEEAENDADEDEDEEIDGEELGVFDETDLEDDLDVNDDDDDETDDDGDEWELDEFDEPGQVRVVNAAIGTFLSTLVWAI